MIYCDDGAVQLKSRAEAVTVTINGLVKLSIQISSRPKHCRRSVTRTEVAYHWGKMPLENFWLYAIHSYTLLT